MKTPGKEEWKKEPMTIVVIGGSGDLARKKIFPALFSLYCQNLLPEKFQIFGFSRSAFSDEAFREKITEHLTCRYVPGESCEKYMRGFLQRCFYVAGDYGSTDAYLDLYQRMTVEENSRFINRMFYMAIPPFLFLDVSRALGAAGFVKCGRSDSGWSRTVIEKPFGRDLESSTQLVKSMATIFNETQTFRIDHYLGKEVIQNLIVLRFANLIFEPIWSREYIQNVQISFKEDFGVGSRGGYFDEYGIIRDVMQNHLLQILALIAMEKPTSLTSRDIRNEKVKVLRDIPPPKLQDLVLGQYQETRKDDKVYPSYTDEKDIPKDSIVPTYAAMALCVKNQRWDGVPFLLRAGKAVDARMTEIRIQFRKVSGNIFSDILPSLPPDELVIRVQPDEAIYFNLINKAPGLKMELARAPLDLRYESAFREKIPEAYESLLQDVIRGDKSLFIREDELSAAWEIFTPVLHEAEARSVKPEPYAWGSQGPEIANKLAEMHGTEWQ